MAGVVVSSSEFSLFEANAPIAGEIESAMRQAAPQRNPRLGGWVGPAPRITRKAVLGGFETDVSWLYAWPDTDYTTQNLPDLKNLVRGQVDRALLNLSSTWSEVVLTPYSQALHGPVDFWASGRAANTQTRVIPPTGIARLTDIPENPVGPTTDDTHPTTTRQAASGLVDSITGLFRSPITWVIVGGVVLFIAYPYVKPYLRRMDNAA